MATTNGKTRCVICDKEKATLRCGGCLQEFCYKHLGDHRQNLNKQLDEIEVNRDLLRQTINEQTANPKINSLIEQIDKWEEDSIRKIQQTLPRYNTFHTLISHRTRCETSRIIVSHFFGRKMFCATPAKNSNRIFSNRGRNGNIGPILTTPGEYSFGE